MVEKSSTAAALKAENASRSAVKKNRSIARLITIFTPAEIRKLFAQAQPALKVSFMDIRIAPSLSAVGRILIVIPRKVGTAPQRNLIRRRLKSIYYREQLFSLKKDVLVFIKPGAHTLSFDETKSLLLKGLRPHD
ncbi:MAG TPA: ribonuclease P protein component [Candidatus Babeliales bacterium]|nr:ribonuclease P protein component [Candidatus Babeliales bacterium]